MLSASQAGQAAAQVQVEERGPLLWVRVSGSVTEDAVIYECLAEARNRQMVFDLGEMVRINSCGVRDWVRWMKALEERGNQLFLVRCSPATVAQFNMIRNFTGQAHVVSVLAPYICPECDAEETDLVWTAAVSTPFVPKQVSCSQCGAAMEFDEIPESYFDFVRQHVSRSLPPGIADALKGR